MTASRSPAQASNESGSVKNNSYICHNSHVSLNYNHGQAKIINLQNSNVQCEFAVHATQLQCVKARGGLSAWTMINHKKHFLSVVSLNKHVKNGPELICPWLQCHWGKLVCFIKCFIQSTCRLTICRKIMKIGTLVVMIINSNLNNFGVSRTNSIAPSPV